MTILMQDSFTNTNGTTLENHTSDSGHKWSGATSSFNIQNNRVNTVTTRQWSNFNVGTSNFSYAIKFDCSANTGAYLRVRFRYTDESNYFWFTWMNGENWDLRKVQAGSNITIGSVTISGSNPTLDINNKQTLVKIICNGDTIEIFINNTLAFSHTDSFNNTADGVGFYGYNPGHRFDDVLIESLGTTDPEEPIGEDGSTAFDLLQSIYTDSTTQADTRQTIYSDGYLNGDTRQIIYQDGYTACDLKQMLYANLSTSFDTKQAIFEVSAVHMDSQQVIYETASTAFDMLQEYYQDGQTGSTPFDMRIQLYEDDVTVFDSKQEWYEDGATLADLKQAIYEAGELNGDMKLILYSDSFIRADLRQLIYSDEQIHFGTKQVLYDTKNELIGVIHLRGERKLYIELQGKQELYVNLKGGVSMTKENQSFSIYQGETKYLLIDVKDVEDLTGSTFTWTLKQDETVLLTKTNDINVVNGKIQIKIVPDDTNGMNGTFFHVCEMIDTMGNGSVVTTGAVTVLTK
jgi:hypothetical protein